MVPKLMGTINLHIGIIGLSVLVNSYISASFYGNPIAQCKSLGNNFGISMWLIYSGIPFQIYLGNLVLTLQPEMRPDGRLGQGLQRVKKRSFIPCITLTEVHLIYIATCDITEVHLVLYISPGV